MCSNLTFSQCNNSASLHFLTHAGKLLKKLAKKAKGKLPKWLTGPLRKSWEKLKDKVRKLPSDLKELAKELVDKIKSEIKSEIEGRIKKYIEDFLDNLLEDLDLPGKVKEYWMDFLEWIGSFDPVSMSLLHHL